MEAAATSSSTSSTRAPVSNPFQIDMIFKMIMEYVGCQSQTGEVLNCRLVGHSWNKMALDVLKDQGCILGIGFDTIAEETVCLGTIGIAIYKPRFGPWPKIDNVQELQDLTTNKALTAVSACNFLGFKLGFDVHDHVSITRSLKQLPNMFITSIIFDSFVQADLPGQAVVGLNQYPFWNLLEKCCSTLRYFDYCTKLNRLRYYSDPYKETISAASDLLQDAKFPRLEEIYFDLRRREVQGMLTPLSELVNNSPKLRKLKLFDNTICEMWTCDSHKVGLTSHELLNRLSEETKNRLQDLEIPMLPFRGDTAKLFSNFIFKNLDRLKTHIVINNLYDPAFFGAYRNCLANNLPALTCYEFHCLERTGASTADDPNPINAPLMLPESALSRFTSFGLYDLDYVSWDSQHYRRLPLSLLLLQLTNKCTALKYFMTDLMSCFELAEAASDVILFPGLNLAEIKFATVETLHIKGLFCDNYPPGDPIITDAFKEVFPNLRKIIFDMDFNTTFDLTSFGESIFPEICKLGEANTIESIEFTNYFQNWLGTEFFNNSNIAKSLVYLGLKLTTKDSLSFGVAPMPLKVRELDNILRSCPRLKLLEVSSKLVISNEGKKDFEVMIPQLQDLKMQFPQTEIKLV